MVFDFKTLIGFPIIQYLGKNKTTTANQKHYETTDNDPQQFN